MVRKSSHRLYHHLIAQPHERERMKTRDSVISVKRLTSPGIFDASDESGLRVKRAEEYISRTKVASQKKKAKKVEMYRMLLQDGLSRETRAIVQDNMTWDLGTVEQLWQRASSCDLCHFVAAFLNCRRPSNILDWTHFTRIWLEAPHRLCSNLTYPACRHRP
jgi:hypothetical protein